MGDIRYANVNGKLVGADEARIHVLSPAVKCAAIAFETIRGYWNAGRQELFLFRLPEHLERLARTMRLMRFDYPGDLDGVRDSILELVRANGLREDMHLRVCAYLEDPEAPFTATGPVGVAIAVSRRARSSHPARGQQCVISSWLRASDRTMPSRMKCVANYHTARLASLQAQAEGYDNVIFLNSLGKVAESASACVFLLRDAVAITPSLTNDVLESITRHTVMQIATEYLELESVERDVDRTELYLADEAFLCSTGREIVPVVSIDRYPIGAGVPGGLTAALQAEYLALASAERPGHEEWRTPVYG